MQGGLQEQGLTLTPEQISAFLGHLAEKGCRDSSVQKYRRDLSQFFAALPEGKQVRRADVAAWREHLAAQGYAPRTINASIAEINSLLDFLGHRECQLSGQLSLGDDVQPELSRNEYLRLLSTARALGKDRAYLLIKLFAITGLGVQDVPLVTVEAVRSGRVEADGELISLPAFFQEELLDYIRRRGLTAGPVFVSRNGRPLYRTAVFDAIRRLSRDARVPEEKCSPRCLKRLWQTTQADMEANVRWLVEQTHQRLLEQEQLAVGWNEAGETTVK